MRPLPTEWDEPPWGAPIDADALIRAVPANATISGVFLTAVAEAARARGHTLHMARERYTPFTPYPLREHCELMVEAATTMWPELPLRQGLRKLGRGSPVALMKSVLGRVVLGSAEGPTQILRAMAKSYPLHTRPGSLEVHELGPRHVIVRMLDIHYFLDSQHVRVFEGVMRFAGVEGQVRMKSYSRTDADLSCEWR